MSESDTTRLVKEIKDHIGVRELIRWLKVAFFGTIGCTVAVVAFVFEVRGNIHELSTVTLRTQTALESVMLEHRNMDRRIERHETLLGTIIHER